MSSETNPLVCSELLGHASDERYAGRRIDAVPVASSDASKRRLRVRSEAGLDVAIDLARGSFLRHGAVLADDGERILAVTRIPEEILRVCLSDALGIEARVSAALRVGHAFGNQHVPVDVEGDELLVPITTSREIALRTLENLQLEGVKTRFEQRPIALERPLSGHAHAH